MIPIMFSIHYDLKNNKNRIIKNNYIMLFNNFQKCIKNSKKN